MKRTDFVRNYGLGTVEQRGNKLIVSYRGNMGTPMKQVDEMTKYVIGLGLDVLKTSYEVVKEEGSPDYSYCLIIKVPRGESFNCQDHNNPSWMVAYNKRRN